MYAFINNIATNNRNKNMIIEACVDSLETALAAEESGATQIELCSRLDLDGLTPTLELLRDCLNKLSIPIKVMLRPLPGSFEYQEEDRIQVQKDIQLLKSCKVRDIVFGTTRQGALNLEDLEFVIQDFGQNGYRLNSITIHRAIDTTIDPVHEVARLKDFALENGSSKYYVLSSGGAATAIEGAATLNEMIIAGAGVVTIIAAGKISSSNLKTIQKLIPSQAYHGRKIVTL